MNTTTASETPNRRYSVGIVLEQRPTASELTLLLLILEARSKEEAVGRAVSLAGHTYKSPAILLIQALEIDAGK